MSGATGRVEGGQRLRVVLGEGVDQLDGHALVVVVLRNNPGRRARRPICHPWQAAGRSIGRDTANPHLIVTRHTAFDTRPVGRWWITEPVRRLTATLERLRVDRHLDEALAHGPDALHLAAIFGIYDKTALRYADAARQILETEAERHAIASSLEPTDPPTLNDHDGPLSFPLKNRQFQ